MAHYPNHIVDITNFWMYMMLVTLKLILGYDGQDKGKNQDFLLA